MNRINELIQKLAEEISKLSFKEKVDVLNRVREELAKISPFDEPVDYVKWVPAEKVEANDYNPNKVAPPEMKLLEHSIKKDGYTQPIVAYYDKKKEKYVIVDGFHRHRIGKEIEEIRSKLRGYLPLVIIDKSIKERIASTIRHNRARGTHEIIPMSKIVERLYFQGWSDKRIREELGMDKDELLRLKQFAGLGNMFKNREFSQAWE